MQMTGDAAGAREQIVGEFTNRSKRVIGLLEGMRAGGKNVPPLMLTAAMKKKISVGRIPVLSAPDEDEWAEF